MFFQPPDEGPNCSLTSVLKGSAKSRRQKKLRRKNKLKAIKKLQIANKQKARTPVPTFPTVPITMSSYAENFTRAATWQLKQELAYWKSKAMALEHENIILHKTVRKVLTQNNKKIKSFSTTPTAAETYANLPEDDSEDSTDIHDDDEASDKEFEVSEEFIQFLKENQAYRESARQERERIKAQSDEQKLVEEMEAGPSENAVDHQETLKKLYGDSSERIAALEMSLKANFISISDKDEPTYWPNIPFNFNSG